MLFSLSGILAACIIGGLILFIILTLIIIGTMLAVRGRQRAKTKYNVANPELLM